MREWRDIKGFEGLYQVSDDGLVLSVRTGNILKGETDKNGYRRVKIGGKNFKIHRLVAAHFIGERKDPVNHKDGNKNNNCLDNLEYLSHTDNIKHAYATGLRKRILKIEDVRIIKNLNKSSLKELSSKFGVSARCIQHIRSGNSWKNA